jgi:hypothetical protein
MAGSKYLTILPETPTNRNYAMAPTKDSSATTGSFGLNPGELQLCVAIIKNLHQRPECNWEQVAIDIESTNATACRDRFGRILKRNGWLPINGGGGGADGSTVTPKRKRQPRAKNGEESAVKKRQQKTVKEDAGEAEEKVAEEDAEATADLKPEDVM